MYEQHQQQQPAAKRKMYLDIYTLLLGAFAPGGREAAAEPD